MTRDALTDTQSHILQAAAARSDGAILPLPAGMTLKGATLKKVMAALAGRDLIQERRDGVLIITKAGRRVAKAKQAPLAPELVSSTKQGSLLALLRRSDGATLPELMTIAGWQAHSVRGFLSGTVRKRMGLRVNSERSADGVRRYSVAGGA